MGGAGRAPTDRVTGLGLTRAQFLLVLRIGGLPLGNRVQRVFPMGSAFAP